MSAHYITRRAPKYNKIRIFSFSNFNGNGHNNVFHSYENVKMRTNLMETDADIKETKLSDTSAICCTYQVRKIVLCELMQSDGIYLHTSEQLPDGVLYKSHRQISTCCDFKFFLSANSQQSANSFVLCEKRDELINELYKWPRLKLIRLNLVVPRFSCRRFTVQRRLSVHGGFVPGNGNNGTSV